MIEKFPEIVTQLAGIADRFATALDYIDTDSSVTASSMSCPTDRRSAPPASAVST